MTANQKNAHDDRKIQTREQQRKHAMVTGRFTFLGEDDKTVLDESLVLKEAALEWKSSLQNGAKRPRIAYEPLQDTASLESKPPAGAAISPPEAAISPPEAKPALRKTKGIDSLKLPGAGETFAIVWVTSKGEVVVDKDVMLLNMKEVIKTKEERADIPGPKGLLFAIIPSEEADAETPKNVEFDQDLFWSVGFLYKHFKTCGLQKWDRQMADLKREAQRREEPERPLIIRRQKKGAPGKYIGKLSFWKGNYGFLQCTSGDHIGDSIFLHYTDISSPYLHLVKGLEFRFDIIKEFDYQKNEDKFRAVKAHPCLCKYCCAVHESGREIGSRDKKPRQRRSFKSGAASKFNDDDSTMDQVDRSRTSGSSGASSPGDEAPLDKGIDQVNNDNSKDMDHGKKRRSIRRFERKSED